MRLDVASVAGVEEVELSAEAVDVEDRSALRYPDLVNRVLSVTAVPQGVERRVVVIAPVPLGIRIAGERDHVTAVALVDPQGPDVARRGHDGPAVSGA